MDREDWFTAYEERAAILEYDECLPRSVAESLAKVQTLKRYGPISPISPQEKDIS
jgi:hypothetical protein